mgnify:FL=1|tara:strand:+ start:98 stop:682 length:585 start_codon:yes stop_codon:yes gene_type:complete
MSGFLTQIVGSSSGVSNLLNVDSVGKIGVLDSVAAGYLTTISSSVSGVLTVASSGTLTCADSQLATTNTSLADIETALTGTLNVSSPTVSTTNTSLASADTVGDGTTFTSASVDLNAVKDLAVFGSCSDTSANISMEVSADDTTYFVSEEMPIYVSTTGVFVRHLSSHIRYVKFKYVNSSGSGKTITMNVSYKI